MERALAGNEADEDLREEGELDEELAELRESSGMGQQNYGNRTGAQEGALVQHGKQGTSKEGIQQKKWW